MYSYEYPRPALTADCVIFGFEAQTLKVLLIERAHTPYQYCWALPGGFVDMDETADQAANRELEEETGLTGIAMTQFHTFSGVDRDPRGRVVSVAYFALVNIADCKPKASDDARNVAWFSVDELPALAFDHADIVDMALARLQQHPQYQNALQTKK